VRPLILPLSSSRLGCNIGGLFVNILAYADDMVVLAPSCYALQSLIKILECWCTELDIVCNILKTVCMIFKPKHLDRHISADFPCFTLDNCKLKFVSQFRYLGHKNDNLKDDDDIKREIKKLLVNTNTLVNRFQRCSHNVKLVLFKSFCMCMYDLALWKYYSVTVYNKFKSAYNKGIKKLFGFARCDSMTGIFMYLSLPTADTIVYNARILFVNQCAASCNRIVRWFTDIDVLFFIFFFC